MFKTPSRFRQFIKTCKSASVDKKHKRIKISARGAKLHLHKLVQATKECRGKIINGLNLMIAKCKEIQDQASKEMKEGELIMEEGRADVKKAKEDMAEAQAAFDADKHDFERRMASLQQEMEDGLEKESKGTMLVTEAQKKRSKAYREENTSHSRLMVAKDLCDSMAKCPVFILSSMPRAEIREMLGWKQVSDLDEVEINEWNDVKNLLIGAGLADHPDVITENIGLVRNNMSSDDAKAVCARALGIECSAVTLPPEEEHKRLAAELGYETDEENPAPTKKLKSVPEEEEAS